MESNRREFYRLKFYGEEEIVILHTNDKAKGKVLDVSVTGLSFEANYEFNFSTALLQFELDHIEFERKSILIRKKNLESGKTFYAVRFQQYTEKDRKFLFQTLMRIDAKKRLGRGK